MNCLFLGGPLDGKSDFISDPRPVFQVNQHQHTTDVVASREQSFNITQYHLHVISANPGNKHFGLYVETDWSKHNDALIEYLFLMLTMRSREHYVNTGLTIEGNPIVIRSRKGYRPGGAIAKLRYMLDSFRELM